jgi:UDP-2-acetamido-3-amino-2,3-dideoxy-glucuronate N-acetyltransferase
MSVKIHHLADVQTSNIGGNTVIWQYAIILRGAVIGSNCNINCHTFIENNVIIGNNVTVKSGVFLWDGITIEDYVFIGPNATFTNDKFPRSKQYPTTFQATSLEYGCSIGANATILGGVRVGKFAIVAAASVVTKDVPAYALVKGNPARVVAWLDVKGNKLTKISEREWIGLDGQKYTLREDQLFKL